MADKAKSTEREQAQAVEREFLDARAREIEDTNNTLTTEMTERERVVVEREKLADDRDVELFKLGKELDDKHRRMKTAVNIIKEAVSRL